MRTRLLAALLLCLCASPASAWPVSLLERLARDARRLLPASLHRLLAEREDGSFEQMRRLPSELGLLLARDLQSGRLATATLAGLRAHAARPVELLREGQVSEGLLQLGAVAWLPAHLSDPVLAAGAEGLPPGVAREYYAFVETSLSKIPVVLDDRAALELAASDLPGYWQSLVDRSREQSAVIRGEMWRGGRVVDHRSLDYRSPVFGVASLAYSRSVTAIAATWLALWREANGDLTRQPATRPVAPRLSSGARP
jgi:hypothetical protein